MLDTSKVLLFIKSVDSRDREKVGLLLETDDGLMTGWAVVKRVYSRFDKRHECNDEGSASTWGMTGEVPTQSDETRGRANTNLASPTNIASGPFGGVALEELTKMVRDLQIAHAWRDGGGQSHDWRPPNGLRCIWCDGADHIWRDCADFAEALRSNVVYLWNGQVHASETQRPLKMNTG